MINGPHIKLIRSFPHPRSFFYTEEQWYHQNGHANVIMNCNSKNIYYDNHWTPLSLKCSFSGKEFYKVDHMTYAVSPDNFLVLNEGCVYASYIDAPQETESFTLHFTKENI